MAVAVSASLAAERAPTAIAPQLAARAARLRYVSDDEPGIRRRRSGRGFLYLDPAGERVREPGELRRIRALAIPPAWTDVWICVSPRGHLQATGRDARGRKQYRYHADWQSVRDEAKYARLLDFAAALPHLRARVQADLGLPGLPREKVLAALVRLLDRTAIRIGNAEYARENDSYGLTTLRTDHVSVAGSHLELRFRGKSGKPHGVRLSDRRLARIVQRLQDLPGQELFQYLDEAGEPRSVDSADVNEYLRGVAGEEFSAKDFRTWTGTVLAARTLGETGDAASATAARRHIAAAVRAVAAELRNTPAVCRRCYIHPAILEAYQRGALCARLSGPTATVDGLHDHEARVVAGLRQLLAATTSGAARLPA